MSLVNFIEPRTGEQVAVRDVRANLDNPWAFPTHLAVGPKGQLAFRHMTPDNVYGEIGDVPIKCMSGHAVLDPMYVARGWVMYEDLCAGRVPGVAADADAWKRWQSLIQYNKAGRVLPKQLRDDDKLYHPEVARRRKAGGVAVQLSDDEIAELFPGMDIEAETESVQAQADAARGGRKRSGS